MHFDLILYLFAYLLILAANLIKNLASLPNESLIRGCTRRRLLRVKSLVRSGIDSTLDGDPEVWGVASHDHRHDLGVSQFTTGEVKVLQRASCLFQC